MKSVTSSTILPILIAHCMNDALQSILTALFYPIPRHDLLSPCQIGTMTLFYQIAAAIFQPLCGLLVLAYANTLPLIFLAVFLIGLSSSILHPEASRLTSMTA